MMTLFDLLVNLTDWVVHIIVLVSLLGLFASFFLKFIPFVVQYRLAMQALCSFTLLFGVWCEGIIFSKNKMEQKAAAAEVKIANIKTEGQKENVQIVERIIEKKETIREKGNDVIRYIDREIVKIDPNCSLPASIVKAHNAAALGKTIGELK